MLQWWSWSRVAVGQGKIMDLTGDGAGVLRLDGVVLALIP